MLSCTLKRLGLEQLGADAETIHAYARRRQTVSELQQRIGEYLRLRHVLAPSDSVLRAIGAARHKARTLLTQRMAERLSAPMREGS